MGSAHRCQDCRNHALDGASPDITPDQVRLCDGYVSSRRERIAPGRRIIALTVFAKTRMRENAEISRAARAMARCQQAGHTPDEDDDEEPR
ncbi:MAG TPA: hypothetical protein VHU92_01255 [Streptosporangiaceae bacterium]|jgi:hypothetical protein|nr:hypothetical protein [Streptosporangiaceae bacterium]